MKKYRQESVLMQCLLAPHDENLNSMTTIQLGWYKIKPMTFTHVVNRPVYLFPIYLSV